MDELLKDAIADAKAVRETALANAKLALEEAFTPRLKSMLSKKIQSEMEDAVDELEIDELEDEYEDEDGNNLVVETTTSWCFVGAGLRLSMELFGPEYSMFVNTLDSDLKVFFSRKVAGAEAEDLVEKQNAESGEMPVVSNETDTYGYTAENRHMVQSFLAGKRPEENFDDGVSVTELLMTAYMSAEQDKTIPFPPSGLDEFIPKVAKGEWNPKKK